MTPCDCPTKIPTGRWYGSKTMDGGEACRLCERIIVAGWSKPVKPARIAIDEDKGLELFVGWLREDPNASLTDLLRKLMAIGDWQGSDNRVRYLLTDARKIVEDEWLDAFQHRRHG